MQQSVTTRIPKQWLCVYDRSHVPRHSVRGHLIDCQYSTLTAVPTAPPISGGNGVAIANFAFSAQSLTVKVGTKVTWTNNDRVTHTVTADGRAFNHMLSPGNTFRFPFPKAETSSSHCAIHPSMTATIVVQEP